MYANDAQTTDAMKRDVSLQQTDSTATLTVLMMTLLRAREILSLPQYGCGFAQLSLSWQSVLKQDTEPLIAPRTLLYSCPLLLNTR